MTAKKVSKCDCLNWCGDDPWLNKGKASMGLKIAMDLHS